MALSLDEKQSTDDNAPPQQIKIAFSPVNKRPKHDTSFVPRHKHTASAQMPIHSKTTSKHAASSSAPPDSFWATGMDGDVLKLHDRVASIPITEMGVQFQIALEEEMSSYSMEEVIAAAPFEIAGRGIAGIEEMAQCVSPDRVYFGVLQIEIGHGTFARHKNVFIHFQGDQMKVCFHPIFVYFVYCD